MFSFGFYSSLQKKEKENPCSSLALHPKKQGTKVTPAMGVSQDMGPFAPDRAEWGAVVQRAEELRAGAFRASRFSEGGCLNVT